MKMVKYDNLKSEHVEDAEKVIRDFSRLLYGNSGGSMQIDELLNQALKNGKIKEKEQKYVFYTWLTIDGFEKKYYKACGTDLTTEKSSAWIYTKDDLEFYTKYKEQYEIEPLEGEEND